MDNIQISDGEAEVMKVLWAESPRTLPEIVMEVQKVRNWEGVTIKTMLTRLLKKGAVGQSGARRNYRYEPQVTHDEYLESVSNSFLEHGFGGAPAAMLSFLVKRGRITRDDLLALEKQIGELEK